MFTLSNILKTLKLGNLWRYKIKAKEGLIKTIYVAIMTYLVLHLGGCIFTYIGFAESLYPNTWIVQKGLIEKSNSEIYITSLYYCFVVLTTVGYGDIKSANTYERIFTIIWMLFGIAFYSFTISFITFFFTTRDNRKTLYMKKLEDFLRFANQKGLKKELREKVIKNLEFSSHKISYRWLNKDFQIFKDMPLELKYELLKELHPDLLESPFFGTKDHNFVVRIINLLKPMQLKEGEFLWHKEDKTNYIVFITKGHMFLMTENIFYDGKKEKSKQMKAFKNSKELNVLKFLNTSKSSFLKKLDILDAFSSKKKQKSVENIYSLLNCKLFAIKQFSSGCYIGDEEIYAKGNRLFHFKAGTNCEMYLLSRIDFENIIEPEFPHIYKKLIKNSKLKLEHHQKMSKKLLQNIYDISIKSNVKLKDFDHYMKGYGDKDKFSKNYTHLTKNNKILSLRELYKTTNMETPIEAIFKDLNIKEYQMSEEEINSEEDEEYIKIKTPGLQKMYKEWKSKLKS